MATAKNYTECMNPATGAIIGQSPLHTVKDLEAMVAKGRSAQPAWRATPIRERVRKIRKIERHLMDRLDDMARILAEDDGKLRFDALTTEIIPAVLATRYYCKNARRFLRSRRLNPSSLILANKVSRIRYEPFGVVGIISPWNYPFSIAYSEVIMGLLAGNAVILKTATETQMTGLSLAAAITSADLPDGVFQFINLPGRVAGDAFLESGVDKLFFTGSVPVGKKLMAKAAETLTPVSLELGGNDAMLVDADADLERATNGAIWAGLQNAGQSCGGVERIYVHQEVYQPFLDLLKDKVDKLRPGLENDFAADMGVMTTAKQKATVAAHVDDALKRGARIYARARGDYDDQLNNYYPPTVLVDVDHSMDCMRDETFGPVLGVMPVADMDAALTLANDSYLGLTGSVWSRNRRKARRIATQMQAGTITINDHLMSHGLAETSWGGFKQSGIGRTHGELGFKEMLEPQFIVDDILPGVKRNLWWHPYSEQLYNGMIAVMQVFYARGLWRRLRHIGPALRVLPRIWRKG
jgi:acyl-CoA reductase-like NAD-dependent aldehyde dehydrogenase